MLSVTPNEFLTFEYNDIPFISSITIITSERSGQSSYYQSYMGHLDDIQTALKPLKNRKILKQNFYDHFRTSWTVLNDESARPEPIVALFDGLFL